MALQAGAKPAPTRGAPLSDFRTAELEIAGIMPDLVAEVSGPSASDKTLRGSTLAQATGQRAPAMPEHVEFPPLPEKK